MKKFMFTLACVLMGTLALLAQAPTGFYYSAAIYKAGKPVAGTDVQIAITLTTSEKGGTPLYEQAAQKITTDAAGMVNVPIEGEGLRTMDWSQGVWVHPTVTIGSDSPVALAAVKLAAVPYAMNGVAGMTIRAPKGTAPDAVLFQVQNEKGEPILKVTPSSVDIITDDSQVSTRGPRGGFAVGRRNGDGTVSQRMSVNDGVSFLVDGGDGRGPRGGFAVSMRGTTRGDEDAVPLFSLNALESFLTVGGCGMINSVFSLRDRCNEYAPVMQVGNDGQVAAKNKEITTDMLQTTPMHEWLVESRPDTIMDWFERYWYPMVGRKEVTGVDWLPNSEYTIEFVKTDKAIVDLFDKKELVNPYNPDEKHSGLELNYERLRRHMGATPSEFKAKVLVYYTPKTHVAKEQVGDTIYISFKPDGVGPNDNKILKKDGDITVEKAYNYIGHAEFATPLSAVAAVNGKWEYESVEPAAIQIIDVSWLKNVFSFTADPTKVSANGEFLEVKFKNKDGQGALCYFRLIVKPE